MHQVAPSLLSADFSALRADIEMVNRSEADWFHLDIMDGVFVPNISFGFPVVEAIRKFAQKPLDVHLMLHDPGPYLERFKDAGASLLSVHYESCIHLHRTIQAIQSLGMKAGVVLNPHTPVSVLEEIISKVDVVLVMSVNPGYGGQSFIPSTIIKIRKLKQMIEHSGSAALIEVDGGIGPNNAGELYNAGATILVAGNSVFSAPDPLDAISRIKSAGNS